PHQYLPTFPTRRSSDLIIGEMANRIRADIESKMEEAKKNFAAKELEHRLENERIDVTMPGKKCECGHKHPMSIVIDEISDIFIGDRKSTRLNSSHVSIS